MSGQRPWYVGLPCRWCGERVTGTKDGLGEPQAEHAGCKKRAGA